MDEPMILHPDQADELRRLLGTVEDWLLHTSPEVLDDLGGFLTSLSWGTAASQQLVAWLIHDLGEHTLTLHPTRSTARGTGSS
jgi:hypothetical protein